MKLNLKQPKYVLPLLALPFLCLFFYVFHSSSFARPQVAVRTDGLNGNVGSVSQATKKKSLASKLDAFRNTYTETGGGSAVSTIPPEVSSAPTFSRADKDRSRLDSINQLMKQRFAKPLQPLERGGDQDMARAITAMHNRLPPAGHRGEDGKKSSDSPDPMDVFKQQMAYMDSVSKARDPAFQAERQKALKAEQQAKAKAQEKNFSVTRADADDEGFNTVRPEQHHDFIKAIIDEDVTGYAGSRLRIRLLDDIKAGDYLIGKGTYLYALITGFSGQRVTLIVPSIMSNGKIFPVKLQVYDLDGLPGLYVPESAFRDFTKDVSGNTIQGVSLDGGSTGTQFIMSSVDKIFQSTSTAITGLIRKNKARLKYSSSVYLIDGDSLQQAQKTY